MAGLDVSITALNVLALLLLGLPTCLCAHNVTHPDIELQNSIVHLWRVFPENVDASPKISHAAEVAVATAAARCCFAMMSTYCSLQDFMIISEGLRGII